MTTRQRRWLGAIFFAVMFVNFGVATYKNWLDVAGLSRSSYDGWTANLRPDGSVEIIRVDQGGPAKALQLGEEFVSLNGVTLRDDRQIINYNRRVGPGTQYTMVV